MLWHPKTLQPGLASCGVTGRATSIPTGDAVHDNGQAYKLHALIHWVVDDCNIRWTRWQQPHDLTVKENYI